MLLADHHYDHHCFLSYLETAASFAQRPVFERFEFVHPPVAEGSDYVRKYFDVKKRAFLSDNMRDFCRFYAKFLFVNRPRNNRCEIRAFVLKIMRVFPI